jgi:hypothetical protein
LRVFGHGRDSQENRGLRKWRAMRPKGGPPAVLVGIDTEADDQWSEAGRARLSVKNALRLPALQGLFDSLGVRPTYLVSHEMAASDESRGVLRDLLATGRCEIGAHLHPWSTPSSRESNPTAHTFPHQLPDAALEAQLRELTERIEADLGVRPSTYRAGRWGVDGRSLRILEGLGYRVDTSVDPLLNERRKGGTLFAGASVAPYHPDYEDVRRPGKASILEIPVSSATMPPLPKPLEHLYALLPPIPYRGALKRFGLRPVWLRPSYTPLPDMKALATRLAAQGVPCFNIPFHSSEVLPGGSPYTPDERSVQRLLDDLKALLEYLVSGLGAVGRTLGEFAASRP